MTFSLKKFQTFCSNLVIETKELGMRRLSEPLGSQRFVMNEVAKALEDDIHFFVILKGRQMGITTISLALDLFWHFTHPGLQGTLVTDTEENRDMFRTTLSMYMNGLPNEYKIPLVAHNRNQLTLKNRSRLFYQVAGKRSNGGLGRGKAITFLHGTETSSWGDEEGLASLLASLAERNPDRFYLFESTARGFNMFEEMYRTAERAKTQRAIFCGWWRNELYMAEQDSSIYRTYWDGKPSPEEKEWIRDIRKQYGFEINSRQVAWHRWKLAEDIKDPMLMYQEFPPTADHAFVLTGSQFFSNTMCTNVMKEAKKLPFDSYKYSFGANFEDTVVLKTSEKMAQLKVWEEPVPNAYYVIGADPAYGSSDWADRFAIQVFRCYADGYDQVAEFASSDINPYQFAWIICHLGGAYANSTLNLETNGPGQACINEMRNLKRHAANMKGQKGGDLLNVLGSMTNYIWRRNDSLSGVGNAIGWVTTSQTKERMLTYYKDYFERNMCRVKSEELIEEMKKIRRDDGSIEAPGRGKDDRVIAAGLASAAYAEQVQPALIARHITRTTSARQEGMEPRDIQGAKQVQSYLSKIGIRA